jgi:CSLREA domain-containing protein
MPTLSRLLTAAGLIIACSSSHAENFTVDQFEDAVDANPGDQRCATAAGHCSLRAAVQEANTLAGIDIITLPSGTYSLSLGAAGEDNAAEGDLDITDDLTLQGAGAASTIIDAGMRDRIFDVHRAPDKTTEVSVSGVSLINGALATQGQHGGAVLNTGTLHLTDTLFNANRVSGPESQGGALCNVGGVTTIERVEFRSNQARLNGGALCNLDGGAISITNSRFALNRTEAADGSAHHHGGSIVSFGTLIINDTFLDNTERGANDPADSFYGGALFIANGFASLDRVTITGSTSVLHGGAIHAGSHSSGDDNLSAELMILRSRISDNRITGGSGALTDPQGAGVFITGDSKVYIHDSEISGNDARGSCSVCAVSGGGIYNNMGDLTLNSVRVTGNHAARWGGGIYNGVNQRLAITNSIVTENTAGTGGGGIAAEYSEAGTPTATVDYSLISENVALFGGGLAGSAIVRNSTFWANKVTTEQTGSGFGSAVLIPASFTEASTNLVRNFRTELINVTVANNEARSTGGQLGNALGGTLLLTSTIVAAPNNTVNCVGVMSTSDYNIDSDGSCGLNGDHDQAVDPQVVELADNGGPTASVALDDASPVIASVAGDICPQLDQRLFRRPTEQCDPGAFQHDGRVIDLGAVGFEQATTTIVENTATVAISVLRSGSGEAAATVDYVVRAGAGNTSTSPKLRGTLAWEAADLSAKSINIATTEMGLDSPGDTFTIELYNPVTTTLSSIAATMVSIEINTPTAGNGTGAPSGGGGGGGGPLVWVLFALFGATAARRGR